MFGEDMFTREYSQCAHRCRQVTRGRHGWTLALQDDRGNYESAGHDYVLDMISEKDLAPGFPVCNVDWLAGSVDQLSSQSSDIYGSVAYTLARRLRSIVK